jgi:hypothetical protein
MKQLQLKNKALKKENLRLLKKIARLEAEKTTLENALKIAEHPTIVGIPEPVLLRAQKLAREKQRRYKTV